MIEKTEFKVLDMHCVHCVKHVEESIKKLKGVKKVKIDLESKNVTVYHKDKTKVEEIKEAIVLSGYTPE
ncbi:MAG: heavy-metal-associated domain-containing protein [Bacillales bacterium]|nr:heavy-metal-associated domain-containing protein [Bacillales bacterium]